MVVCRPALQLTTMKFFIFDGDEERFLLDRLKELNRNFDKETRIKFLKSEIRKREKILRKRWRRHRHRRRIKKSQKEETTKTDNENSDLSDVVEEDESGDDISDDEVVQENDTSNQEPFLFLLSNVLNKAPADGGKDEEENANKNTILSNSEISKALNQEASANGNEKSYEDDNTKKDSQNQNKAGGVVGRMLSQLHGVVTGTTKPKEPTAKKKPRTTFYWDSVSQREAEPVVEYTTR